MSLTQGSGPVPGYDTNLLVPVGTRRIISAAHEMAGEKIPVCPRVFDELLAVGSGMARDRWLGRLLKSGVGRVRALAIAESARELNRDWWFLVLADSTHPLFGWEGNLDPEEKDSYLGSMVEKVAFRGKDGQTKENKDANVLVEHIMMGVLPIITNNIKSIPHEEVNEMALREYGVPLLCCEPHLSNFEKCADKTSVDFYHAAIGACMPKNPVTPEAMRGHLDFFLFDVAGGGMGEVAAAVREELAADQDFPGTIAWVRDRLPKHTRRAEDDRLEAERTLLT